MPRIAVAAVALAALLGDPALCRAPSPEVGAPRWLVDTGG